MGFNWSGAVKNGASGAATGGSMGGGWGALAGGLIGGVTGGLEGDKKTEDATGGGATKSASTGAEATSGSNDMISQIMQMFGMGGGDAGGMEKLVGGQYSMPAAAPTLHGMTQVSPMQTAIGNALKASRGF